MIILIAESKSMSEMTPQVLTPGNTPEFEAQAEEIVQVWRGRSVAELSEALRLGPKNAQRLFEELYDFPDKSTGAQAMEAFTGVVFRELDVASLCEEARIRMEHDVRIVSSLYGMLRPEDVIKSYRLDFGMKAAPGEKTLSTWWRPTLTKALVRLMQERGEHDVLNLLPLDASKCFDWKIIKNFGDVYIANFKEVRDGGKSATPSGEKLKRLRAKLLRHILTNGVAKCESLRHLTHPDMMYECDSPYPGHLLFTV